MTGSIHYREIDSLSNLAAHLQNPVSSRLEDVQVSKRGTILFKILEISRPQEAFILCVTKIVRDARNPETYEDGQHNLLFFAAYMNTFLHYKVKVGDHVLVIDPCICVESRYPRPRTAILIKPMANRFLPKVRYFHLKEAEVRQPASPSRDNVPEKADIQMAVEQELDGSAKVPVDQVPSVAADEVADKAAEEGVDDPDEAAGAPKLPEGKEGESESTQAQIAEKDERAEQELQIQGQELLGVDDLISQMDTEEVEGESEARIESSTPNKRVKRESTNVSPVPSTSKKESAKPTSLSQIDVEDGTDCNVLSTSAAGASSSVQQQVICQAVSYDNSRQHSNGRNENSCQQAAPVNGEQHAMAAPPPARQQNSGRLVYAERRRKYNKLIDCKANKAKYNTYAVLREISKMPYKLDNRRINNRFVTKLKIQDESLGSLREFRFDILDCSMDFMPPLEVGAVLRIHEMSVQVFNNEPDGRVYSGRLVTVVKGPVGSQISPISTKTEDQLVWDKEDEKRVKELREWYSFVTKIGQRDCKIEDMTSEGQYNLYCRVIFFGQTNLGTYILRIEDGTLASVCSVEHPEDESQDVIGNDKSHLDLYILEERQMQLLERLEAGPGLHLYLENVLCSETEAFQSQGLLDSMKILKFSLNRFSRISVPDAQSTQVAELRERLGEDLDTSEHDSYLQKVMAMAQGERSFSVSGLNSSMNQPLVSPEKLAHSMDKACQTPIKFSSADEDAGSGSQEAEADNRRLCKRALNTNDDSAADQRNVKRRKHGGEEDTSINTSKDCLSPKGGRLSQEDGRTLHQKETTPRASSQESSQERRQHLDFLQSRLYSLYNRYGRSENSDASGRLEHKSENSQTDLHLSPDNNQLELPLRNSNSSNSVPSAARSNVSDQTSVLPPGQWSFHREQQASWSRSGDSRSEDSRSRISVCREGNVSLVVSDDGVQSASAEGGGGGGKEEELLLVTADSGVQFRESNLPVVPYQDIQSQESQESQESHKSQESKKSQELQGSQGSQDFYTPPGSPIKTMSELPKSRLADLKSSESIAQISESPCERADQTSAASPLRSCNPKLTRSLSESTRSMRSSEATSLDPRPSRSLEFTPQSPRPTRSASQSPRSKRFAPQSPKPSGSTRPAPKSPRLSRSTRSATQSPRRTGSLGSPRSTRTLGSVPQSPKFTRSTGTASQSPKRTRTKESEPQSPRPTRSSRLTRSKLHSPKLKSLESSPKRGQRVSNTSTDVYSNLPSGPLIKASRLLVEESHDSDSSGSFKKAPDEKIKNSGSTPTKSRLSRNRKSSHSQSSPGTNKVTAVLPEETEVPSSQDITTRIESIQKSLGKFTRKGSRSSRSSTGIGMSSTVVKLSTSSTIEASAVSPERAGIASPTSEAPSSYHTGARSPVESETASSYRTGIQSPVSEASYKTGVQSPDLSVGVANIEVVDTAETSPGTSSQQQVPPCRHDMSSPTGAVVDNVVIDISDNDIDELLDSGDDEISFHITRRQVDASLKKKKRWSSSGEHEQEEKEEEQDLSVTMFEMRSRNMPPYVPEYDRTQTPRAPSPEATDKTPENCPETNTGTYFSRFINFFTPSRRKRDSTQEKDTDIGTGTVLEGTNSSSESKLCHATGVDVVAATDVAVAAATDVAVEAATDGAVAAATDGAVAAATDVAVEAATDGAVVAATDVAAENQLIINQDTRKEHVENGASDTFTGLAEQNENFKSTTETEDNNVSSRVDDKGKCTEVTEGDSPAKIGDSQEAGAERSSKSQEGKTDKGAEDEVDERRKSVTRRRRSDHYELPPKFDPGNDLNLARRGLKFFADLTCEEGELTPQRMTLVNLKDTLEPLQCLILCRIKSVIFPKGDNIYFCNRCNEIREEHLLKAGKKGFRCCGYGGKAGKPRKIMYFHLKVTDHTKQEADLIVMDRNAVEFCGNEVRRSSDSFFQSLADSLAELRVQVQIPESQDFIPEYHVVKSYPNSEAWKAINQLRNI